MQKKKGPAVPNVPGTYAKSSRAVGSGVASPAVKPNIVALEAEAAKVTGTFATVALVAKASMALTLRPRIIIPTAGK